MNFTKSIHTIDSHTMGEPTRIVVGGIPNIPGDTMAEKKAFLEKEMDAVRTTIMHEPRGHNDMFGSIILAPTHKEADFGIIFMDGGGYLNMCGHGSIGAITVAIETGMVERKEPFTEVAMDTPAGLIRGKARIENGRVKEVSIVNVPAFLYKKDVVINVPDIGDVILDISFGGSFFAIVNAKQLMVTIDPKNTQRLIEIGLKIREIINHTIDIKHPNLEHIKTVDLVEIFDDAVHQNAHYRNVVIFGQGQVDRSPCGTGTSAKLATLYAKGQIKMDEPFIYESILGTTFKGRILGTTKVGDYEAIIPEITGSAFITGFNQFVISPDDPVKNGFVLK